MSYVILDKSFLDAANKEEFTSLCNEHTVLMTDVLFHELVTTRKKSRQYCFNKFPSKTNPVELIPNIGTLLRYELETHKQCTPFDRRIKAVFKFNDKLRDGTFEFTDKQDKFREKRDSEAKSDAKTFFELATLVPGFFSQLNKLAVKNFPDAVEEAKQQIASDTEKVREIYRSFLDYDAPPNPVDAELINVNWAYFRWIQVRIFYSLNLLLKYHGQLPENPSQKFWRRIEHDLLDSEYVILGALTGALASNEKPMITNFKSLCSCGETFSVIR
ncbi:MAG: hypothetical protein JRE64_10825 [Deltaproteobacteria bacterium]|nr:hypothetical protein [Deltaproteobacteria bacterium]